MKSKLKTFVMDSGERYCLLIDSHSDLPLFYPNLYVTTQIRNKSLSYSAIESTLSSLSVLISFLDTQNENIEKRIREGRLFQESELDALKDFCQMNFRTSTYTDNLLPFSKKKDRNKKVSSATEYSRITVIAHYLTWLSTQILGISHYHLGLKGGELLNIRVRDIDFGKNQLIIARRAGEKDDPRTFQPLVKTRGALHPKPSSLGIAAERIAKLQRELELFKKKNDALLQQFVTWQYNAYKYGLKEHQLNEPLPRIDRERSDL